MPNALPHFSYKAGLHEQHIERRAGEQAQKHIPFPPLQCGGHGDGDQLRQCVVRGEHRVLEAVDEQQPDDREGQDGAILATATPCSMCRRLILNAGIETVVARTGPDSFLATPVREWIDADDTLSF